MNVNIPLLFLVSIISDADLLIPAYLEHRGPTHSLIIFLLLFLPAFILYGKKAAPYFIAVTQHSIAGDFLTEEGIQLLWPITNNWYGAGISMTSPTIILLEWSFFITFLTVMITTKDAWILFEPHPSNLLLSIPILAVLLPPFFNFPLSVPLQLIIPHLTYLDIFILSIIIDRISSLKRIEQDVEALTKMIRHLEKEKETLRLELWKHKRKPSGKAEYALLLLGAATLALSIIYASSILAFIGLGLTFWGALLLFIKPTRYVKSSLLDSTAISTLTTIDRVIANLDYKGKGTYLPPQSFKGLKEGKIFIPYEKNPGIPPVKEVSEGKVFLENPKGICLTPPGLGLVNLFEKELEIDFAKVDLNYLQNNLPKLFIEGLEIAEDFEMSTHDNIIHVRITESIYKDFCREARKLSNICSLGCPLCSSIALALTRTTGKPIVIEKTEPSADGKTIEVYYQILE